MLVSKLCENIDAKIIGPDVDITGLNNDNRKINPGDAFFCIVGYVTDGHKFAKEAVDKGASCIFVEHKLDIDITQVVVKNTRRAMAFVSANFYNHPSARKKVIGITGTNGKTTIAHIVGHILDNVAVIGTNGIEVNGKSLEYSGRTTPESFHLQKLYNDLDVEYIVMEVSAHALSLDRVLGTKFEVTAFTNLSQDHLDYYKDMNEYFEAKAKLFSDEFPAKQIICIDDEWGQKLIQRCNDAIPVSINDKVNVDFPLKGKFNQQNMKIAYAICKALNIKNIEEKLQTMPNVEGRMQEVARNVFVDYAHTPEALKNAITSIKEIADGKVITVFGCGGDRDKDKRAKMGSAAQEYSDYTIVTSDNPRSENPQDIINDIKAGMKNNYEVIVDRKEAIIKALNIKNDNDVVLIAGKGHEKTQEVNGEFMHFDDVEVVKNEIKC